MFENGGCKMGRRDIFTEENSSRRRRQTSVSTPSFRDICELTWNVNKNHMVVMHRFYSDASLDVDAPCNNLLQEVSILFLKRMDVRGDGSPNYDTRYR